MINMRQKVRTEFRFIQNSWECAEIDENYEDDDQGDEDKDDNQIVFKI